LKIRGRAGRPKAGLLEELPVLRNIDTLVRGNIELVEYRVYRANRNAVGAVDAGRGVDVILIDRVYGVDAIDRADLHAGGVLNSDAGFSYYVGHTNLSAECLGLAWLTVAWLIIEPTIEPTVEPMIPQNRPDSGYIDRRISTPI
jgi:hypothetical protein